MVVQFAEETVLWC